MIRQIFHVIQGYMIWQKYRLRFRLGQKKVLLVLAGENRSVDEYALIHLEDYVKRKIADQAVILASDDRLLEQARAAAPGFSFRTEIFRVGQRELLQMYDYYCFEEYFDNVVFTYTDRPKDNLLGKLLKETNIDEEEAVCLGCYCLREIPKTENESK